MQPSFLTLCCACILLPSIVESYRRALFWPLLWLVPVWARSTFFSATLSTRGAFALDIGFIAACPFPECLSVLSWTVPLSPFVFS